MSLRDDFNFNQRFWPGALADNAINDCWVLAALRAVHAVAPWFGLVGVEAFRKAAGNASSTGTIADTVKGIRGIYPKLADLIDGHTAPSGYEWAKFLDKLKAGHVAEVFLNSGKLPPALQFGYSKDSQLNHAVTVAYEGGAIRLANPLAKPHSKALVIEQADLRRAMTANQWTAVSCVFMPTEAEAFKTHPLYVPSDGIGQAEVSAAYGKGYADAKANAVAAVEAV